MRSTCFYTCLLVEIFSGFFLKIFWGGSKTWRLLILFSLINKMYTCWMTDIPSDSVLWLSARAGAGCGVTSARMVTLYHSNIACMMLRQHKVQSFV